MKEKLFLRLALCTLSFFINSVIASQESDKYQDSQYVQSLCDNFEKFVRIYSPPLEIQKVIEEKSNISTYVCCLDEVIYCKGRDISRLINARIATELIREKKLSDSLDVATKYIYLKPGGTWEVFAEPVPIQYYTELSVGKMQDLAVFVENSGFKDWGKLGVNRCKFDM